ncbi:MAG TPA: hypothetical protein VK176_16360 [Phycisphaerales bacterium]|nr:hypothetical protein [Phycisphaerales bacterium]
MDERLGKDARALKLPPPGERICTKMGLAVLCDNGTLRYSWEEIAKVWLADPCVSLADFCNKFEIPYHQAHRTGLFNAKAKRAAKDRLVLTARRRALTRALFDAGADPELEAQKIRSTLDNAQSVSALLLAYVRGHLEKHVESQSTPNVALPTRMVKDLSQIARDCMTTLRGAAELMKLLPSANEADGPAEPEIIDPDTGQKVSPPPAPEPTPAILPAVPPPPSPEGPARSE